MTKRVATSGNTSKWHETCGKRALMLACAVCHRGQLSGVRMGWILFFWWGGGAHCAQLRSLVLSLGTLMSFLDLGKKWFVCNSVKTWFICCVMNKRTLLTSCWFRYRLKMSTLTPHALTFKIKTLTIFQASAYNVPVGGSIKKKKKSPTELFVCGRFSPARAGFQSRSREPWKVRGRGEKKTA